MFKISNGRDINDITFQTSCDESVNTVITAYMKVYMLAFSSGKRNLDVL